MNASVLGNILGGSGAPGVPGVTDAYVVDNPTNEAQTIGGVSVAANSLYCCVAGGAPSDIGVAIIQKKPPGCSYTGGTSVTVQDPNPVYGGNGPSYNVLYDVAQPTPIYINVVIVNSTSVPSTALEDIQVAVINAFTGSDGGTRARIGAKLLASRYMAGIIALGAWAQVVEITIGLAVNPVGFTAQLNINQVPTIADANITMSLA